jgi:hypothetical protein
MFLLSRREAGHSKMKVTARIYEKTQGILGSTRHFIYLGNIMSTSNS